MTERYESRYLEFIQHFNAREYWESHEVLEKAWLEHRDDPNSTFYKGLIQLAASLYHVEKGNWKGAWSLHQSASGYLAQYPEKHLGIDTPLLLRGIREFIAGREKEGSRTRAKRPMIYRN